MPGEDTVPDFIGGLGIPEQLAILGVDGAFIDEEILSLFEGDDRMTRTILVGKRSILDVFYNSIVIYMDDDNLALGRDGDGMIYYDL